MDIRPLEDPLDQAAPATSDAAPSGNTAGVRMLDDPLASAKAPGGDEPEEEGGAGDAAIRGLKQTFAPFLLSKEDLNGKHGIGSQAVEAGTAMAGDVALGAALGSVVPGVGTAVGAVALPIAQALYRGMGYEYARSKAQGENFNILRGGLNAVTELNPLIHGGGRLFKAASQAALEAGREYAYSGDREGAAISGILGGAFGAAFHHDGPGWGALLGQVATHPGSKTVNAGLANHEIQELLAPEKGGIAERVFNAVSQQEKHDPSFFKLGDKLEQAKLRDDAVDDFGNVIKTSRRTNTPGIDDFGHDIENTRADIDGFKVWVANRPGSRASDEDVESTFEHYLKSKGMEKPEGSEYTQVEKDYALYKAQKVALTAVERFNSDAVKGITTKSDDPTTGGIADKLRDMKFQMRKIDRATGGVLNLEGAIDQFVAAKNKQSVIMATYLNRANKLTKEARRAGLSNEELGAYLADQKSFLDPTHKEIAEKWRTLWEDARQGLKREGLNVDFLGGGTPGSDRYLPMSGKRGADMHTALRREMGRLESTHGADFLNNADSMDLRRTVAHALSIEPEDVRYKSQIETAMKESLKPTGKSMNGYEANATFRREPQGVIPAFARNMDTGDLFVNYLNNNFKSAIYHDAFVQMSSNVDMLKSMGMHKSAEYLENYLGHLSGKPSDRLAAMQYKINKHVATSQAVIDGITGTGMMDTANRSLQKWKRDMPRVLGFMTGQVYPNWLGWNVRAAVRNYAQPMLTTAPELGGVYGTKLVARASADAFADWAKYGGVNPKKKFQLFDDFLQPKNIAPGEHFGEAADISSKSMRTVKGFGGALEVLDKYNSAAMWAYGLSDNVNRYVTYKVGQSLAEDFARGVKPAQDYIRRVASEGNKTALRKIVGGKDTLMPEDVQKLGDELARQLISKTQFNYGKESMNEFGREFGRLFSMFSKWPTMIASDSEELISKHGWTKGMTKWSQRYMAPYLALMAVGSAVLDTKRDPKLSYLLGKSLEDAAPVKSLGIKFPPVIQTANDGMATLFKMMQTEGLEKKAKVAGHFALDQALAYLPGTGAANEVLRANRNFHFMKEDL